MLFFKKKGLKKKELLEIKNIIAEMKTKITRRLEVNVEGMSWKVEQSHESDQIRSVAQSCPTLCDPLDCSLPGSSVHRVSLARILKWVVFPTPSNLPYPGIEPTSLASPAFSGGFFATAPPGKLFSSVQSFSHV